MAPMAWQSSTAMGANGGSGGQGEGNSSSQGPAHGTEYTLQGVMRFLQMEWHRHERDRNAWEIERAEMKARIARLEGENRTGKKMQDSLSNHIKLLEGALRREREKIKSMSSGKDNSSPRKDSLELPNRNLKPESKSKSGPTKPPTEPHNSFLDVASESRYPFADDPQRTRTRGYLDKGVQEITYLLTPPAHPPPANDPHLANQEMVAAHGYARGHHPQQMLGDVYMQQQQQQQQQRHKNFQPQDSGLPQASATPNHQPPPVPSSDPSHLSQSANQAQHSHHMSRHLASQPPLSQGGPLSLMDRPSAARLQPSVSFPTASEDSLDKLGHGFDAFGRPMSTGQEGTNAVSQDDRAAIDSDPWNFDEPSGEESSSKLTRILDADRFQNAHPTSNHISMPKSPPRVGHGSSRRKSSMSRRRSDDFSSTKDLSSPSQSHMRADTTNFKVRFALRGHLDVVRAVIFTGGGSPSEPEICTAGDDGVLKRWIIPASYGSYGPHGGAGNDLDVTGYFTHRGHAGAVTSLAACPLPQNFSTGGRVLGDGWVFSGGQDTTIRVWERGRVDPKATLDGHTDAVWSVCVLPGSSSMVFGGDSGNFGGPDRILLASGAADGTIKIWAISAPPQLSSPHHSGSRRGVGGSRRHSVTSGSGFPSSPQPSMATATPFHHTLVHTITRGDMPASPTCIAPLSVTGGNFVASYNDASVLIFDTRTAEEVVGMASLETYDGTPATGVNSVVATTLGLENSSGHESGRGLSDEEGMVSGGATGTSGGVEGVVISGHEDRYIRFFDANSGQCTYTMLAHPAAISSLSLSPDGRELVSAGHDASLRFWSLEKRSCTQEITSHRLMRGEGVCSVVWSQDGRWVVSAGGDGVVKVFSR